MINLDSIKKAAHHLKPILNKTPILSWTSKNVFLKAENLQLTGSFKARGAYIKFLALSEKEKQKGVIAMSAGNHAQAVAYHAHFLRVKATIVMPENTPFSKIERTARWGADIKLYGSSLHESGEYVKQLIEEHSYTLIHPYDDHHIITGQATLGLELLEELPDLDTVLIPIGGGGLCAGMALACKQIKPSIEIIGVQSTYSPHMFEKLYPNRVHNLPPRPSQTIAEGIAVKCVGELTSQILEKQLDDILLVEESSIEQAIDQLIQQSKLVVEGAGAAGLAAYNTYEHYFHHKKVGIVLCGGNIDSRILSTILLRGLVLAGKLVRLKIQIQDAPGILGKISSLIGKAGGNIFEVSHQRLFNLITVKMTDIDAIIEARDTHHIQHIIDTLNKEGFPTSLIH